VAIRTLIVLAFALALAAAFARVDAVDPEAAPAPATTWLGVQSFAASGFLIEIEAAAVVAG
jgi:enamine deaminase RidA (YjgF/YER057c/UK114 family)